ncbi:hypothetical protein N5J77_15335 [Sphingobium yanoikuyae]|uniref:Uncharacterized protein n=5 Tax=Sphingobium TaxID=165695 RepID=A0A086PDQ0_SPHHM|nr:MULTISPECIES: hypothetical protein [Sphingobium]KXU33494.1 hypothetical protein AXW74_02635 [Sphingobium sp. AM]KYC33326.1 hypothetical protein A0J57_06325 [Sphingobium sp. 22B]EQB00740.1 hypothetical protein L485_12390 [Sphingobium baderi LL03]KFG91518.1 hypothetical protein BV98_000715 [Sphingobium herbicidovorans NBRC 16415]KMS61977.1 hypothetical protein V475_09630 [Sphingobium baderi LL03]
MQTSETSIVKRLTAMLCIALVFVFAGMSLSNSMDRIQHAPGAPIAHEHMLLGDLSLELDHADDHHSPQPDDSDDDPVGHLAGGHHHHADGGSGLIVPDQAPAAILALAASAGTFEPQRRPLGVKARGPERPPKDLGPNA